VRLVVSAPEEGEVMVEVSDLSADPFDSGTCTITFTTLTCTPSVTIDPASAEILVGETIQFTTSCTCDEISLTSCPIWEIDGCEGIIDDDGLYTAGSTACTATISVTDPCCGDATATAQLVVRECTPTVDITPEPSDCLPPGSTLQFTASTNCNGDTLTGCYVWQVTEGCGGTIDDTGLYTAPSTACTETITVTDTCNGNLTASVTVVICSSSLVSPDPIQRSRWVMFPTLMVFQSDTANFVRFGADRSRVSYSPANAVIPMPRVIVGPHTIWQLVFVNPPWLAGGVTDGTLAVTVTTGMETVTGETNIQMLPFGLDK